MSWLLRDGDVLAALEERRPGWQLGITGAVIVTRPAVVHTWKGGVRLDLAWCANARTDDGRPCLDVRRIVCLGPRRVAWPRPGRGAIVAAEQGAFERWHLQVGDRLEVRPADE